jgi:hypothetical protein
LGKNHPKVCAILEDITIPWNGSCKGSNSNTVTSRVKHPYTQADFNEAFQHMKLSEAVKQRLTACSNERKVRMAIVFLTIKFERRTPTDVGRSSHASAILFDLRSKSYRIFDPDNAVNTGLSWTVALNQNPAPAALLSGFRAMTHDLEWAHYNQTMQRRFEQDDIDPQGVCGVLVCIVSLLCMRFGVSNPKLVADLLLETYSTGPQRRSMIMRFISFLEASRGHPVETVAPKLVPDTDGTCAVVSAASHNACSRRSCMGLPMCWQHNHILRNPFGNSKKCNAQWDAHHL